MLKLRNPFRKKPESLPSDDPNSFLDAARSGSALLAAAGVNTSVRSRVKRDAWPRLLNWQMEGNRNNLIWRYSYAVLGLATVVLFLASNLWFPSSYFDPSRLTSAISIAKAAQNTEIGKLFGGDEYTVMKAGLSFLIPGIPFLAFHKLRGNRKLLLWLEARLDKRNSD